MSRVAFAIARDRPDLPSLGDTSRIGHGGLAIIHGPAPLDAHSPGLESLQAFASTMDALHARETILPLRFGSLHNTDDDLRAVLRVRLDEWRGLLDGVEGCVEIGLRVLLDNRRAPRTAANLVLPARPKADKPGLAYLASRRAKMAEQDALDGEAARIETSISEGLEGLYRRKVVEGPAPGRENLLSLVFLVARSDIETFRVRASMQFGLNHGKYLVTGPWPPYHFASSIS